MTSEDRTPDSAPTEPHTPGDVPEPPAPSADARSETSVTWTSPAGQVSPAPGYSAAPYAPPAGAAGPGSPSSPYAPPAGGSASGTSGAYPPAYGTDASGAPPVPPAPHQPYGPAAPPPYPPGYGGTPPPSPGYGGTPPPPAYGAAGAPAGYGAAGAPAGYGAQPWGPPQPYDNLAIASLVTSGAGLLLLCGLPGPVGLGLGIGALARIRRTGARGRGLAIAGIVIGAVSTLGIVLGIGALVVFGSELDDTDGTGLSIEDPFGSAAPADEDVLPPFELPQDVTAGTCWEVLPETWDLSDATAVPCEEEHEAEVVAVLAPAEPQLADLTVDDPVFEAAQEECVALLEALDPDLPGWGATDVWLPHPDQFSAGERTGYCVYQDVLGTTGSVAGASS